MTHKCPRRAEGPMLPIHDYPTEDAWREDGTCSYCGSIGQDDFFAAVEAGCEIVPTDKNYKLYVRRPNPKVGQPRIVSARSHAPSEEEIEREGWVKATSEELRANGWISEGVERWVRWAPTEATAQGKFYFQHLDDAGKDRFIELVNTKAIKFAYPGHLYVLPFFCARGPKPADAPTA